MNFTIRRLAYVVLIASAVPVHTRAQQAEVTAAEPILDEVIVTAQKREESLRDVPLSVEAVSGEKLQDAGIIRVDDLQAYVPNLKMSETGIANNIYIRGIGSGLNQGFEQSVSIYQDGVYHGRGNQARMPFLDLARVEVLRGPQPILFGKNAVAGAINLVANPPTRDFEGQARVSYDIENHETTADAAISGPITDSFRARLASFYRKSDGYIENATTGGDEPRRDDIGARLMLAADLGEAVTSTLRLEMGNFDSDGRQIEIFGETPITSGPFAALPAPYNTYSGALAYLMATNGNPAATPDFSRVPAGLLGDNKINDVRGDTEDDVNGRNYSNNRFREAALSFDVRLPNDATLTSLSAFSKYNLDEGCDCDFVAAPLITAGIGEDYRQYSEELRFTSSAENRLQWIGGLFAQRYELAENDFLHVPTTSLVPGLVAQSAAPALLPALLGAGGPCNSLGLTQQQCLQNVAMPAVDAMFRDASNPRNFNQNSTLYSAFLQGTAQLNEKWSLTLGGRLNHENKDGRRHVWLTDGTGQVITDATTNLLFDKVLGISQHDISGTRQETNFSPLFNIQYHYTPDSMTYLSVSQGTKSGGFDARSNRSPAYVDPDPRPPVEQPGTFEFKDERATTYEVGIKTRSASGNADMNVDAFYTNYKDLQTSAFDGRIGFNVGNGSAEVRGVEFEGRWRPARALTLSASMAALDFQWTHYNGQCYYDLVVATGGVGNAVDDQGNAIPGNCNYAGKSNQFAPRFTGVLSAEYVVHVGALALTTTLDAVHSSSYFESLDLDPMLRQHDFTKLNARIGLGDDQQRWQVALIGKNLTDRTTVGYAADTPLAQALFNARSYYGFVDPPRSVAVELRVRF